MEHSGTAHRWRRHGHDRLYIRDASGRDAGYVDLTTGQAHPVEAAEDVFHTTVEQWRAAHPDVVPTPRAAEAAETLWRDLAANVPGERAQAQASQLRRAAPVRTIIDRLLGRRTDERAWRIGAAAEQKVGASLNRLPSGWHSLHAVEVGQRGSDIDHLVLGPGGVFTINTKHHPGARVWAGGHTLMVNGHRTPYVRNATFEAQRAARLLHRATGLSVPVRPVVAFEGVRSLTVKGAQPAVSVIRGRDLAMWLLVQPDVLDDATVATLFEHARRSTTWT